MLGRGLFPAARGRCSRPGIARPAAPAIRRRAGSPALAPPEQKNRALAAIERAAAIDPKTLPEHKLDMGEEAKAWKTVWSAGQGAGAIHDVLPTAELVARLRQEFAQATDQFAIKTGAR